MKIIGLLTAWASEDWIEYSIKQALDLVDELLISIGPHNNFFKRIEDKTLKNSQKYLNNEKIKFIETICNPKNSADENKCATLNKMLQISKSLVIGNIIWLLDSDEFYSEESIKEIKDFIKNNDFDQIDVISYFFCINFTYYIKTSHIRLFKIKNTKFYFTDTQMPNPKPKKTVILLDKSPMFHYSLLTGEQLKGIYWMSSGDYFKQFIWYLKIYKKYDPKNEAYWMKKNQFLTGNYGFWFNNANIIENDCHGLFLFKGKHPVLIENSNIRAISDFRSYMKNKQNYKIYLKVIKKIIKKNKRFNFVKFKQEKIFLVMTYLRKNPYFRKIIIRVNNKLIKIHLISPNPQHKI